MARTALEHEIGHGNPGVIPWSAFSDITEPVAFIKPAAIAPAQGTARRA